MIASDENNNFFVKVVDFGIAKTTASISTLALELTADGEVLGTPAYMSPEQAYARPLDERSDIYSLGCVMYYALTSTPPFTAASAVEVLEAHLDVIPPDLTKTGKGVPEQLASIIGRMLEKQAEDRYQTMNELLTDLKRHSRGEPIAMSLTGRQHHFLNRLLALLKLVLLSFGLSWILLVIANQF